MARLSKPLQKKHQQAMDLALGKDVLTHDEKIFVIENFREDAGKNTSWSGAFFTPFDLARDLAIMVNGPRIIDLCAGIGTLSFASSFLGHTHSKSGMEIVCVERNADYVAIGKKIVPEATWIQGDIFDLDLKALGRFDMAIGNPPYGRVHMSSKAPRYTGSEFEYAVIDIASDLADAGVFIVPQGSVPWMMSGIGHNYRSKIPPKKYTKFLEETGIELDMNIGIDTSHAEELWHGTKIRTEITCVEFPKRETTTIAVPVAEDQKFTVNPKTGQFMLFAA